jgi:hypothetical protein
LCVNDWSLSFGQTLWILEISQCFVLTLVLSFFFFLGLARCL